MPIPWNDDPPGSDQLIEANLRALALDLTRGAPLRGDATVAMAQDWHRRIFRGIALPVPYYAGEIRDSDPSFPELVGYEVSVGNARGVPAASVPAALQSFEASMRSAISTLDPAIPLASRLGPQQLDAILNLAALAHGEWIRIHPFANGNGRTARLWANWVALRYGLPLFVRLRPRPASFFYGGAAALSMQGNDTAMAGVFRDLLRAHVTGRP